MTLDGSGDATELAGSIMPDHIHLLLGLGPRLTLSQVVGKTKAATSRAVAEGSWQENYFEHRLRDEESAGKYALDIFMNPYAAKICSLEQSWPGWIPPRAMRWKFMENLRAGCLPQPERIETASEFERSLPPGSE